ncbi:MAG: DNA repair protein RecO [Bacteroidetes bacterium]|nr:DNA repair protein RecO [Bacteroidota bacterium]
MVHKTKGIVIRCIKFGDTSLIAHIFTELFGLQSYLIKGIRKTSKKKPNHIVFFQAGAILDLEVYHNNLKNLQYIKEYSWAFVYQQVLFNVVKNAIVSFNMELLQQVLKQPEPMPELFEFVEYSLHYVDESDQAAAANVPLFFMLKLSHLLGFQIFGEYHVNSPVLDLQAGNFVSNIPDSPFYLIQEDARVISELNKIASFSELPNIVLNQQKRRALLSAYLQYLKMHIEGMKEPKSFFVLQEVLS